jgi:hypothetical protein
LLFCPCLILRANHQFIKNRYTNNIFIKDNVLDDNYSMNNVDLKAQIGAGARFKQSTNNGLSKNAVSNFEHKEAGMQLFKETEKRPELKKFKKKEVKDNDPYKSKKEKESEEPKVCVKKLMNII